MALIPIFFQIIIANIIAPFKDKYDFFAVPRDSSQVELFAVSSPTYNLTTGMQFGAKLLKGIISNGFALINLLSLLLITPVVAFYMLRDWDAFVKKVDNLLPRKSKNTIREQFRLIDKALSGFIRGQVSVCVILGLYYSLGLILLIC